MCGQVRQVSQLELRLREAAKLGFKRAIIPKGQNPPDLGLELIPVNKVLDAILEAIPGQPSHPVSEMALPETDNPDDVDFDLDDEDLEAETDLF